MRFPLLLPCSGRPNRRSNLRPDHRPPLRPDHRPPRCLRGWLLRGVRGRSAVPVAASFAVSLSVLFPALLSVAATPPADGSRAVLVPAGAAGGRGEEDGRAAGGRGEGDGHAGDGGGEEGNHPAGGPGRDGRAGDGRAGGGRAVTGSGYARAGGREGWAAPESARDGGRSWPLAGRPAIVRGWEPPAGPYAPGHRGVDLAADPGDMVLAAAGGTVAFAGRVAGRGVLAIEVAGTGEPPLRTTYEPVTATVGVGDRVAAGDPVGVREAGPSPCVDGCLHWGLRRGAVYLDPLSLLPPGLLLRPPSRLLPLTGAPEGQ